MIEINETTNNPALEAEEVEHIDEPTGLSIYIDPNEERTTRIPVRVGNKELTIQEINEKIEELKKHSINGFRDKKGLEKAKEFKSYFLRGRTSLEKESKEQVIQPVNKVLKVFKSDVDEVCDAYKAGQDVAQEMIDAVEKEWELEQERIEQEKQQRVNDRIAAIQAVGGTFNPEQGIYTFAHDEGLIMNIMQLNEFSDEEFNLFVADTTVSWNEEQDRLEQKRIADEAEQARLKEVDDKLKATRKKYRTRDLYELKAIFDTEKDTFKVNDIEYPISQITDIDDDEWDKLLLLMKKGVTVDFSEPKGVEGVDRIQFPKGTPVKPTKISNDKGTFTIVPVSELPIEPEIPKQPFEHYPKLAKLINEATNHWMVDPKKTWGELIDEINNICSQLTELKK